MLLRRERLRKCGRGSGRKLRGGGGTRQLPSMPTGDSGQVAASRGGNLSAGGERGPTGSLRPVLAFSVLWLPTAIPQLSASSFSFKIIPLRGSKVAVRERVWRGFTFLGPGLAGRLRGGR